MSFFDYGTRFAERINRGAWVKFGPLAAEVHLARWGLGLVAGAPGYVGATLGPFALTVGRRFSLPPSRIFEIRWAETIEASEPESSSGKTPGFGLGNKGSIPFSGVDRAALERTDAIERDEQAIGLEREPNEGETE